jgi:hypothetical protein
MAKLDEASLSRLKSALDRCEHPWILAAYYPETTKPVSASLQGTLGYLDWRLHGQFSLLIKRVRVPAGKLALIPSQNQLGKASLLVYHARENSQAQDIVSALKKLNPSHISIAADTWPEPIASQLKKQLSKTGIEWSVLGTEEARNDS